MPSIIAVCNTGSNLCMLSATLCFVMWRKSWNAMSTSEVGAVRVRASAQQRSMEREDGAASFTATMHNVHDNPGPSLGIARPGTRCSCNQNSDGLAVLQNHVPHRPESCSYSRICVSMTTIVRATFNVFVFCGADPGGETPRPPPRPQCDTARSHL